MLLGKEENRIEIDQETGKQTGWIAKETIVTGLGDRKWDDIFKLLQIKPKLIVCGSQFPPKKSQENIAGFPSFFRLNPRKERITEEVSEGENSWMTHNIDRSWRVVIKEFLTLFFCMWRGRKERQRQRCISLSKSGQQTLFHGNISFWLESPNVWNNRRVKSMEGSEFWLNHWVGEIWWLLLVWGKTGMEILFFSWSESESVAILCLGLKGLFREAHHLCEVAWCLF